MKTGRVVRIALGVLAGLLVTTILAAVLVATTGPGHRFLQRRVLAALAGAIDGRVRIGALDGPLWRAATVNGVAFTTPDGRNVIRAERIAVTYALTDFLRGRNVLRSVLLVRPFIELDQGTDGRWNIERLFRLVDRDTMRHARRPFILLRDVRVVDGTLIVRARPSGGTVVTHRAEALNTDLSRLRVSHPDSSAIEADVRRIAARLDNPRLDVRNGDGKVALDGDSIRFDLDHVTLPGTRATMTGMVHTRGGLAFDMAVHANPLTFADLRSVVSILPEEGGGQAALRARLQTDGTIRADVRQADVRSGRSALRGRGILTVHRDGTGTAQGVNVELLPLDLALLAPFVDSLPARGLVRGRFRADGSLRDLAIDATLGWSDEGTAGAPMNTVDGKGRLILGGQREVEFRAFTLRKGDFDFGTIRGFAPPVLLVGRLRARGTLEGPWRAAQFNGALDHYADSGLASSLHGALKLGIGDTTHVDAEVDVDSLSLDLLRRTYPQIPLTGILRGRAALHGPLDSLAVDAALAGVPGRVVAQGVIRVRDSSVGIALAGTFDSLDLNAIRDAAPPSRLAGRWRVDVDAPTDSVRPATGTVGVDLLGASLGGVTMGPGAVQLRLEADHIGIDQATLAFAGGAGEASGAIGRGAGAAGALSFAAHADTIGYLEPLVRFFALSPGDSGVVSLEGRGTITGSLEGTLEAWVLTADAAVDGATVAGNVGQALKLHGRLEHGADGTTVALEGSADSLRVGALGYKPVSVSVSGRLDSLAVGASVGFLKRSALRTRFTVWGDSTLRTVLVDSLDLTLPVHTWRLQRPVTMRLAAGTVTMDTVDFRSEPGTGFLRAAGTLSRGGATAFLLDADSLPLEDLYAAAQRDTTGIKGAFSAHAKVAGSADTPVMELSAQLADGALGDYFLPLARVEGAYRDRHLTLTGGLWRDSVRIVSINGSVPLDLSLHSVAERQLDGPIEIVATADSLDMRVLNALTRTVTGMAGTMALNVRVGGTWKDALVSGFVDITDGSVQIPSIGASYDRMEVRLEGPGNNTLHVARGQLRSRGTLDITGDISFEELTRPQLTLGLVAAGFRAFDIRELGSLTGTGRLTLEGPLLGAVVSGRLVADEATFQFANLVEKRIVSLDDPEFRAMVDSNLAGADLAPSGHTVFFDSLRVDNFTLEMGPEVWLRSNEANIQLAGEIQVVRRFEDNLVRYRIDGTLRAVRGSYKLAIGLANSPFAVTRDFRVTRGTVRFFGTPDFNPEMDVAAEYAARTVQGQPLTVRAIIEGTLLYPRLRLESDSRPPLSETEIASYLMFGQPAAPELGLQGGLAQAQLVAGSLAGGVGQALVNELGLPINYLTIVPGSRTSTSSSGLASSRIEAGAQIGERTFFTLNAGLCEVRTSRLVGLGASIEYRLSGIWSVSAAIEPVIPECGAAAALSSIKSPYQVGLDLFWQQGIR